MGLDLISAGLNFLTGKQVADSQRDAQESNTANNAADRAQALKFASAGTPDFNIDPSTLDKSFVEGSRGDISFQGDKQRANTRNDLTANAAPFFPDFASAQAFGERDIATANKQNLSLLEQLQSGELRKNRDNNPMQSAASIGAVGDMASKLRINQDQKAMNDFFTANKLQAGQTTLDLANQANQAPDLSGMGGIGANIVNSMPTPTQTAIPGDGALFTGAAGGYVGNQIQDDNLLRQQAQSKMLRDEQQSNLLAVLRQIGDQGSGFGGSSSGGSSIYDREVNI